MSVIKIFESIRVILAFLGFYFAYSSAPTAALFWLVALMVIPLSGLTAIESLLFGKRSAASKQRETNSDYQTQSALNNLATAVTAVIILIMHWGRQAQLTIVLCALLFFFFSSLKHAVEYFRDKKNLIHLQRFVLSMALVLASAPIMWRAGLT